MPEPATIGRYEILAEIGRGAMGVVYKARDPVMDRFVAVKTIQGMALFGPQAKEYRERFYREARAAARLSHPGIVTVYDAGEQGETPYMVMEYLEGRTLGNAIDSGERFSFDHIAELGWQMAEALGYAHRNGVVHRDIKPANILLTGSPERAKITDLGVAKLTTSQITTTGQLLGTPSFMAPEQILGVPVDGRADLFSLGVILYWMATGEKPFDGSTITAISYKIIHTETIAPRKLNPTVPAPLENIIIKCLERDPAQRYQSGEELAADLAAMRTGGTVSAPAPAPSAASAATGSIIRGASSVPSATSVGQTLGISETQETLGVGATAQTGLGKRTGTTGEPARQAVPANTSQPASAGGKRRSRVPLLILEAAAVVVLAIAVFAQFHHRSANPAPVAATANPAAVATNPSATTRSATTSTLAPNAATTPGESAEAPAAPAPLANPAPKTIAEEASAKKPTRKVKPGPGKRGEAANAADVSSPAKTASANVSAAPAATAAATTQLLPAAAPAPSLAPQPPPVALSPDTAAKLHLDMGHIPESLALVVLMDGKPFYTRAAGQEDSKDELLPPGTHSFQVVTAAGAMPLGASNMVSENFQAKKKKTLRVELRDNSSGETLKKDSPISSGSATYVLTLR